MSDMNHALASLFADPETRAILQAVAKNRLVRYGDLVRIAPTTAPANVQKLLDLNLINVKSSGIRDFDTLYITSDGLEASRKTSG